MCFRRLIWVDEDLRTYDDAVGTCLVDKLLSTFAAETKSAEWDEFDLGLSCNQRGCSTREQGTDELLVAVDEPDDDDGSTFLSAIDAPLLVALIANILGVEATCWSYWGNEVLVGKGKWRSKASLQQHDWGPIQVGQPQAQKL